VMCVGYVMRLTLAMYILWKAKYLFLYSRVDVTMMLDSSLDPPFDTFP
jgi:hypothetical protein